MIWKILRPQFWMLDRKVRQTNRLVMLAVLMVPVFAAQWIWDNLISELLTALSPEQAATFIVEFMPLMLYVVLGFALLGAGDVMRQLYLASDLDLLMMAPIPVRSIFLVKLL